MPRTESKKPTQSNKPSKTPAKKRFWLGVANAAHVESCVRDACCVFGHGEAELHLAMRRDDGVVFYAPRREYKAGERVQEFVAVGAFASDSLLCVDDHHARRVRWRKRVQTASIRDLLESLELTKDLGRHWGASLRLPVREISRKDYLRICRAMRVDPPT